MQRVASVEVNVQKKAYGSIKIPVKNILIV